MSRYWPWVAGVLAIAVALVLLRYGIPASRDNQKGLSGENRKSFVDSAVPNCVKQQAAHPDNKDVPAATIASYCKCYADRLANDFSPAELKGAGSAPDAFLKQMGPRLEAAATVCAAGLPPK